MRIVIDMQGVQTESRFRGIGRYTMSLVKALVRNKGKHDIFLALNGLFADTIEPIRANFNGLLPQDNIRVWITPGPVFDADPANNERRVIAELIRESFLASLQPDVVLITSLFEGLGDDAVTSVGLFDTQVPTAVIHYDLIPLLIPDTYFQISKIHRSYYARKIESLKRCKLLLAISESTRQEVLEAFQLDEEIVVNISSACDASFRVLNMSDSDKDILCKRLGISLPFIMYTGGADERKNIHRLIEAYAALPIKMRAENQLVVVGKMSEGNICNFRKVMKKNMVGKDEVVFTGYINDDDLLMLYNACKLFVFPSLHEGFGLPPLEAMACGTAVIVAKATSLPEVVGLEDAMFDPLDVSEIAAKIAQVLEDDPFRMKLRNHGLYRVKHFSWDKSANRAIKALELISSKKELSLGYDGCSVVNDKIINAIVSKGPSIKSVSLTTLAACIAQNQDIGIERQIMLDVSELANHDSATGVQRVVRSYLKALLQSPPIGFRIEPVYATQDEGYRYARYFTQSFLGQDTAEHPSDDPVQWQRGDLFFGLDMQHHVQLAHKPFYKKLRLEGVTVKFLIHDLLPIQLADLFKDPKAKQLHEQWLSMIAATDGAICVSKATADVFNNWIDENAICKSSNFQINWVHNGGDITGSKPSEGMPTDAIKVLDRVRSHISFLCVATLEPRKGQQQIVDAVQLLWDEGLNLNLVLVGQPGWKTETFTKTLINHPEKDKRLFWLQGISDEYLEQVYQASTCLIAASINEGFGLPLIEAARHDLPIVARDIPVFREVAGEHALYFSGNTPRDLENTLKTWLGLHQKGIHPKSNQMHWSTWQQSAKKLKAALIEENYPRRQLLVDVSELVQHDAKSGIQRVVRSILKEWLNHPPNGYKVEPVYATVDQAYRYARRFTHDFINGQDVILQDENIEYAPGDVFIGLDLQPQVVIAHRDFYQWLRRQGVRVEFVVYDLLCLLIPQYFNPVVNQGITKWIEVVAECDGALCISKTVANTLKDWISQNGPIRRLPFKIDWFHLGADFDNSMPTRGFPPDADIVLRILRSRISFLMVGTLEPRKGHVKVLDAFDSLWQSGHDINLVIVGKQGWMVGDFAKRLRKHSEIDKHLFWLNGISDEYLERVYAAVACLVAASYGEGFGLPLIEAAQHQIPIIARDIPVFREVAGVNAYYFPNEKDSSVLTDVILNWMKLFKEEKHPKSNNMSWLSWKQSAQQLINIILSDN